jgi:hypothetical protein
MDYDSIIPQNQDRILFYEILVKFTYLVGIIADQNFYDIFFRFFYPTASAKAYGRILSWPNIQLRPKVKIAATVQHWS